MPYAADPWNDPGRSDGWNCGSLKHSYQSTVKLRNATLDIPLGGAPAVSGSLAISYILDSQVLVIDQDGNSIWKRPIGRSDAHSSAVITSQGIVVPQSDGSVSSFGFDGTRSWQTKLVSRDTQILLSPLKTSNEDVILPSTNQLHCLRRDGTIRWQVDLPDICASYKPSLSDNGELLLVTINGTLACFDATDGSYKWTTFLDSQFTSQRPVVVADNIWLGDSLGNIYMLSNAGALLQQWTIGAGTIGATVISGNVIVFLCEESLHAFDSTGHVWQYNSKELLCAVLGSSRDSTLFVASVNELFGLSIDTPQKTWSIQAENIWPGSTLVLFPDGSILVHDATGGLLLIE